jgi:hypothetical protein
MSHSIPEVLAVLSGGFFKHRVFHPFFPSHIFFSFILPLPPHEASQ